MQSENIKIKRSSKYKPRSNKQKDKQVKIRKAVWQFIKDHSRVLTDGPNKGKLLVTFVIDDDSNFWSRVGGREYGYKRYDD